MIHLVGFGIGWIVWELLKFQNIMICHSHSLQLRNECLIFDVIIESVYGRGFKSI